MPSDSQMEPPSRRAFSTIGLEELKKQIRENERIWNGFRQIELSIIGAHSLHDVVTTLAEGLPRLFPRVECATLACVDPGFELTRLLDVTGELPFGRGTLITISEDILRALFPRPWRARLGPLDDTMRHLLFPGHAGDLGSMALVPLVLRDELIGCLNQASREPRHFRPGAATDLLEHLAAVTAMCLDNAVIHERLERDGLTDPLTGLYNRRFFERRLQEEVERCLRHQGSKLVGMLVDVDHFKRINDNHGHQAGDRTLQQVARLLEQELRGSDVLARYGGEEFVLLLPDTAEDQGLAIAERLRTRISDTPFDVSDGQTLRVTISAGLACLASGVGSRDNQSQSDWLLYQADAALYRAKQLGRNRVWSTVSGVNPKAL